jgi:hypothetical protein
MTCLPENPVEPDVQTSPEHVSAERAEPTRLGEQGQLVCGDGDCRRAPRAGVGWVTAQWPTGTPQCRHGSVSPGSSRHRQAQSSAGPPPGGTTPRQRWRSRVGSAQAMSVRRGTPGRRLASSSYRIRVRCRGPASCGGRSITARDRHASRTSWWLKAATQAARSSPDAAAHPQPHVAVHTRRAPAAASGQSGHHAKCTTTVWGLPGCGSDGQLGQCPGP